MSKLYSEHAQAYSQAVQDNIYNALYERPSTQALLRSVAGKTVIDMGCGSGVYSDWLLQQGAASVTCVDASEQMIAIVESRFNNQVRAYVQDLSQGLPQEPSHSADVIICPLVLHYIADLGPVFAEVYRVLKPGGYMVFSTHHPLADAKDSPSGNYFARELLHQEWDTVGQPVAVSFYRRSLSELCHSITANGLLISAISEGQVDPKVQSLDPDTYLFLTTSPNFIFIRCEKG